MPRRRFLPLIAAACFLGLAHAAAAQEAQAPSLADALARLDPSVTRGEQRQELRQMLGKHLRRRIEEANRRSSEAWKRIETKEQWEAFLDNHRPLLRFWRGQVRNKQNPIGAIEAETARKIVRRKPIIRVSGQLEGPGYRVQNLLFLSPLTDHWVSANLYLPKPPHVSMTGMPGIVVSHSHHNPKEQGELQDMGMTWARAGCAVLVPDHLGHGERRQHPFQSAADFDGQFAVGRQDYYFRYDLGMQLHLYGQSLMGVYAAELMTSVSVLLAQEGIDPDKIILLGAVAGGGDPAAVAAAIDDRINCVVPFNFGGPQPETRYPLPDDADTWFNYAGGGSWESTRNLSYSASDGFLPWVIVGSVAPRKLIHAHEFSWDRERDPVWKRYEKIWGFYGARENLAFAHGGGTIPINNAEATHCNNIGPVHRRHIHEAFRKWFGIDVTPEREYSQRRERKELACWTDEIVSIVQRKPVHKLIATHVVNQQKQRQADNEDDDRSVQNFWALILGRRLVRTSQSPKVSTLAREQVADYPLRRCLVETESGITVPVLLLLPPQRKDPAHPVVIAVAFDGKAAFLKRRSGEIAKLLETGVAVCLADLRGCGESGDSDRGQQSETTAHSSTELMLGGTMLGKRVQDLRAVVEWLRGHFRVDRNRIALWGDSFTEPLAADATFKYPRRIDNRPPESDPMGSLVVLVSALADENLRAVYAHGGITTYQSVLESPFVQLPHDCVVPGVFQTGDLPELVAALAPRPVRLEGLVDGVNRIVTEDRLKVTYARAIERYDDENAGEKLTIRPQRTSPAEWLIEQLK